MAQFDQLKLENQLCFPLYAAARSVVNLYTPYLKPLDITYTQYLVMMVLWDREVVTVGELCRKLYLDSGTMTPLIKKLEAKGLVVKARSHEDERVVSIALTDLGHELKEEAASIPAAVGSCLKLSPEEAAVMYGLLYKILEAD